MTSDQDSVDDIINQTKNGEGEAEKDASEQDSPKMVSPNRIIDRLDDVTIQSEEEASKVVDLIDDIIGRLSNIENITKELKISVSEDKADKEKHIDTISGIESTIKDVQDMLFNAMSLLQYQDILRQKIEKIATALGVFYDYLGEFLGKGRKTDEERVVGKHVEDSTLVRDQKLDEIDKIISDVKKD